ncbi:hypothetical protein EDD22DRAFT_953436 [Suillus occidentalis]|nr:hypothetical protein EDD22DRAFT_953436 [Suillus occidentalis]
MYIPYIGIPPLSPLPPSLDRHAFDTICDPFNLDAPMFLDLPDIGDQAPQLRDDIAKVELTPIVPSHIVSSFLRTGDVLLLPGCEDEFLGPRDPIAATAHPEDDSTFRFYRGLSNRRGKKGKGKCGSRCAAQPHLEFDHSSNIHQRIVRSAKKEITKNTLNVTALTEEGGRVAIADQKLKAAAEHILGKEQGIEWASHNSGMLYMTQSEPCKNIMHTCRKHACNLVCD